MQNPNQKKIELTLTPDEAAYLAKALRIASHTVRYEPEPQTLKRWTAAFANGLEAQLK